MIFIILQRGVDVLKIWGQFITLLLQNQAQL